MKVMFHGSIVQGLTELSPTMSRQIEKCVYATDDITLALFFTQRFCDLEFSIIKDKKNNKIILTERKKQAIYKYAS